MAFKQFGALETALISNYCPEAVAVFAAFTTPPTPARKRLIDTLIRTLKTLGAWTLFDVLWMLAAADRQAALINWKRPGTKNLEERDGTGPIPGVITFTADRGFTGDGTTQRLLPSGNWIPNSNGVQYTLNSASMWLWSRTNAQNNSNSMGIVAANAVSLQLRTAANVIMARGNDADITTRANTDSSGLFGVQRVDSATKRYWRNGAQIGADISVASTSLSTNTIWMLGANATHFSNYEESFGALGGSLQGLELPVYSAVLAYMTAVGAA